MVKDYNKIFNNLSLQMVQRWGRVEARRCLSAQRQQVVINATLIIPKFTIITNHHHHYDQPKSKLNRSTLDPLALIPALLATAWGRRSALQPSRWNTSSSSSSSSCALASSPSLPSSLLYLKTIVIMVSSRWRILGRSSQNLVASFASSSLSR